NMSNLDIINALGSVPLLFQPGEAWHYGISADVIAGVIEVVTGVTYGEFLKKEIFEPLEMKDTGFYVKEEEYHRLSQMYSRIDGKGRLRESDEKAYAWLNMYAPTRPPYIESGGGGLYSTLEDYNHFVQMLAAKGTFHGKRLLGRKSIEYISQNQLTKDQQKTVDFDSMTGYGYGNFMRVMLDTAKAGSNGSEGEYGWDGLPGTYFFVDPKEELTLVYMQQIEQGADQELRRKMRQIIYAALDD
ncbi:MAG: serine hydrolase domain-containing protein, partial [Suilimivivens sp.]